MDELTKELLKTKQLLKVTEEEKRGKEEEASQVGLVLTSLMYTTCFLTFSALV